MGYLFDPARLHAAARRAAGLPHRETIGSGGFSGRYRLDIHDYPLAGGMFRSLRRGKV
jgi:hypothetical protein